ncbi:hypothetical protein HO419_07885 [Streptococcus suis]|uniref:hypothetical protein n=1 Tax=Streptococcus suis TaxID=1307 RepID=UPI000CF673C0|nr:hypothetical protein [Streptococcus suis]MBM0272618.1 hypothetical protein [Streptococcus suis]MCK3906480.1 hypothetical protein [Streptococcus suis]MCL4897869.1 hypothetical protein [Streptococcus suis]NQM26208.1 hypothetical protein [Streptococcus suis]NRH15305.1 hypothetical protein [Streptococcus suis]
MRIKDYADSQGVSSQSIYKRIRSPKYRDRLKGHLYRDNQKVENLDLIGIKILEDYHFEDDVIKLEKELEEARANMKELKQELQLLKAHRTSDRRNIEAWSAYADNLERQRLYFMIALGLVVIGFIVAMGFAVF